jgi:hypothetical protein
MGNAVQPWLGRAEPLGFSNPVSLGWVVVRHRCLDSAMVWNRACVKEARRRKWLQRGRLAHRVSAVRTRFATLSACRLSLGQTALVPSQGGWCGLHGILLIPYFTFRNGTTPIPKPDIREHGVATLLTMRPTTATIYEGPWLRRSINHHQNNCTDMVAS